MPRWRGTRQRHCVFFEKWFVECEPVGTPQSPHFFEKKCFAECHHVGRWHLASMSILFYFFKKALSSVMATAPDKVGTLLSAMTVVLFTINPREVALYAMMVWMCVS